MGKSIILKQTRPPEAVLEAAAAVQGGYKANLYTTRRLNALTAQAVERWQDNGWFAPSLSIRPVIYREDEGRDGVYDTQLRVPFANLGNGFYLYPSGALYVDDGTQKLKLLGPEDAVRRSSVDALFKNLSTFLLD